MVSILVAYASKHGATQGIAERIADVLVASGLDARACPARDVRDLDGYDAFVIGAAASMGSWLKEVSEFARRNQEVLAARPVWLFSSGPLGTKATDARGQDLLVVSEPREFAEFRTAIKPRGLRVFFGALDPHRLAISERLIRRLPAARALLPVGDFRDWKEVDAWAETIARELAPEPVSRGQGEAHGR